MLLIDDIFREQACAKALAKEMSAIVTNGWFLGRFRIDRGIFSFSFHHHAGKDEGEILLSRSNRESLEFPLRATGRQSSWDIFVTAWTGRLRRAARGTRTCILSRGNAIKRDDEVDDSFPHS